MIEMTIDSIRVSTVNYQRVIILKEKNTERYLPIWIGPAEADAIAVKLQDMQVPRPLTHDLLRRVISTLGATVSYIVVNDLRDDTFYATLYLNVNDKALPVDCRPSDALALAVRIPAPIYVEESVLEKAGIIMDKETGKAISQAQKKAEESGAKIDEEELRRLSAFKDFIEGLDMGELDKGKGKEKP